MEGFLQLSIDENVATIEHGARVLTGEQNEKLLSTTQRSTNNLNGNSTWHFIDPDNSDGITVDLGSISMINHVELMLWDRDEDSSYSYYVEVSLDRCQWSRIIDYSRYSCRSKQKLYFDPRDVQYIRVVGTNSTVNNAFYLVSFRAMYSAKSLKVEQGILIPEENVASIEQGTRVVEGTHRPPEHNLIAGTFTNNGHSSGYTSHQLDSGCIMVQFPQPYMIDSLRFLLLECDSRSYSYYVETSVDKKEWTRVVDRSTELYRSWQTLMFDPLPVVFVKIVGTRSTADEQFNSVYLECPAEACYIEEWLDSSSSLHVNGFADNELQNQLEHVTASNLVSCNPIYVDVRGNIMDSMIAAEYCVTPAPYPARLVLEENIATTEHGARVVTGEQREELLKRNLHRRYSALTRHKISDSTGITVDLGDIFIVNHIKLMLSNQPQSIFSFYIEVSIDQTDWCRVIDHSLYQCMSVQNLYFEARGVRYIRVTGTYSSTTEDTFTLMALEANCTAKSFRLSDGFLVPEYNVGRIEQGARLIGHNVDASLIDGSSTFSFYKIGSDPIVVHLAQPYVIGSLKFLLGDCDSSSYSYYIETSTDYKKWTRVVDRTNQFCGGRQILTFDPLPVLFIRIVGTHSTSGQMFSCASFECPAQCREKTSKSLLQGDFDRRVADKHNCNLASDDQAESIEKETDNPLTTIENLLHQADYYGKLIVNKNIGDVQRGAQVLTGERPQELIRHMLDFKSVTENFVTRHKVGDKQGITVDLGDVFIINHIKLMLWDKETGGYSYVVEVSLNREDWFRIFDYSIYLCHSTQKLFFHARDVRYIRVVGTSSSTGMFFHLVSLETGYTTSWLRCIEGVPVPTQEVGLICRRSCLRKDKTRQPNVLVDGQYLDRSSCDFRWHRASNGEVIVQLAQPYIIGSIRFRMCHRELGPYSYYIETSLNQTEWTRIAERTARIFPVGSWQILTFKPRPIVCIKIVPTRTTGNDEFFCVEFECPAQVC